MARPHKNTLEYISLDCHDKTTLKRLHSKFGLMGRLFWYELLRKVARTENYFLDLSDEFELEDVLEIELFTEKEQGISMLNALAKWGKIDQNTWENHKGIWIQSLIDRHTDLFKKRSNYPVNPCLEVVNDSITIVSVAETPINDSESTQSKVKESKVKERKEQFKEQVFKYVEYPQDMLIEFFEYWSETKPKGRKMKFEMQQTFDIGRRLKTWAKNEQKFNKGSKKQNDESINRQTAKTIESNSRGW